MSDAVFQESLIWTRFPEAVCSELLNKDVMQPPHRAPGHIQERQSKQIVSDKTKEIDQENKITLHPLCMNSAS